MTKPRGRPATAKARRKALLDKAKDKPCMDCGGQFPPEAMDFDHVRGVKSFCVNRAQSRSLAAIRAEIAKCDLVCSNCHRVRTRLRWGQRRRRGTTPGGRPATTRAKVLAYYTEKPGHQTDQRAATKLGMSIGAFGNARRELERVGLLTIVRVPQPRQGGRDRVIVTVPNPDGYGALLDGLVEGVTDMVTEPCHYRVYKALGPQAPKPNGKERTRLRNSKGVKRSGMKFITLDREDGPPANLDAIDEGFEEAPSVRFIKLFCAAHRKRFGSRYLVRPEDRRHAKRLTEAHELVLLEEMVSLFIAMDGYGRPGIRNFYVKSDELLVDARERISERVKDKAERESITPEEKEEYKIKEISDALFNDTITDGQREEAKQLVESWPMAKYYARHTQEVVRAATTDAQWKRHVASRERYRAERWQTKQS